ncbi:phosphatidate cytidylyltransferase [Candidatus Pelagibacter sp.]|nr:phosphatidate cytidylyltransferase [Candidatus Pelagibacter sp.]
MHELSKRIFTSIFLIILLIASIFNKIVLFISLIFIFYQMIYEFNLIFKKIFFKEKKNYLLILMFISLLLVAYIIIFIWFSLTSNVASNRLMFYFIICTTIFTDIGGYLFGNIFKGKRLSKLSPNKTYSGMYGSYFLSISMNIFIFNNFFNINELIIFTFFISTSSQIGDLFISFLKRKAKIKDTGKILPGHGGLLDRFDGLILAIPIGSIFFKLI